MIQSQHKEVAFFRFGHLAESPRVRHGVFTRIGGVSQGDFAFLNLGEAVGDDPENVRENTRRMMDALEADRLALLTQVHGDRVAVLDREPPEAVPWYTGIEADAAVTDQPGLFLGIKTADCQAVLLFDPETPAVGAVHSGWRGSTLDVVGKTVAAMREQFGTRPRNLLAGVGPSLGPCCAEFTNFREEIPRHLWPYRDEKNHFDFWAVTRHQLVTAGVSVENIRFSRMCTKCRPDLFFSYRRNKITGRAISAIGLEARPEPETSAPDRADP